MKQKNTSDYIIAATVVGCSIVLLMALTMALTGFTLVSGGKKVNIDFPSVAGIRVNSEIRYAGKHVGTIKNIRFLTAQERLECPDNMVRVIGQLDKDAPPLYKGTAAAIISDTVLAEKFVDLIPVGISPSEKNFPDPLTAADVIFGKKVVGFDDLTRAGYGIISNVDEIMDKLKEKYPDIHERMGSLVIHSENLIKDADELVSKIKTILEKNDPNLEKTVADLRVTMQNLKVTSTYAKALTATLGERPWRLVWGGDPNVLPTEEEILNSNKPLPAPIKPKEEEKSSQDKKSSKPTAFGAKSARN